MFRKADVIPDRVQMMARWFVMIESIELRGHCCRDSRCVVYGMPTLDVKGICCFACCCVAICSAMKIGRNYLK